MDTYHAGRSLSQGAHGIEDIGIEEEIENNPDVSKHTDENGV